MITTPVSSKDPEAVHRIEKTAAGKINADLEGEAVMDALRDAVLATGSTMV